MKVIIMIAAIAAMGWFGWSLYEPHAAVKMAPAYAASSSCAECHPSEFESHNKTLHPVIFRPVTDPNQILGDFETSNPLVTFKKEEITYVVGSKWEQVYMRMIDGEYYPFTAKWMVTTQKWVPYKVHEWKKTPASTKCNGCHTTGFNPETYEFKEFGVQCESCHGPASHHIAHQRSTKEMSCLMCHDRHAPKKNDIIVSVKSPVCGQCHSRGTMENAGKEGKLTKFNFPVEYIPGNELDKFAQNTLKEDKKMKNWWGNGISKNRHQEFADFSVSGHAKALEHLKTKKNPHSNAKADDSCLKCHSQDYRSAKERGKPSLKTAKLGLTCVTCHDPHGKKMKNETVCGECHVNIFANTLHGSGSQKHFPCPPEKVGCIDCHMPYIVETGGTFSIRSHAFKIIPPEATQKHGVPNSCQNGSCHTDKPLEWAQTNFRSFYGSQKQMVLQTYLKQDSGK